MKSAGSGKSSREAKPRASASSTKTRRAAAKSPPKSGANRPKKAKRAAAKPPAAKKKSGAKRPKKTAAPPRPKRQRYNSLAQHEVMYQAWLADGTIAGAVRRLRTIEGFEALDERTLKSIYKEKAGTDADWDKRAEALHQKIAERIDTETAEDIARLTASTQRRLLKGLEKLAGVAGDKVADVAERILDDLKSGEMSNQERIYGFAKTLSELMKALRPPEKRGANVNIDNRRLTLSMQSPLDIAQAQTKRDLLADVTRRERAIEHASV